ncbi:MAG: hypothetical protein RL292_4 [Candidatus Parcubacteria bacterium]
MLSLRKTLNVLYSEWERCTDPVRVLRKAEKIVFCLIKDEDVEKILHYCFLNHIHYSQSELRKVAKHRLFYVRDKVDFLTHFQCNAVFTWV